VIYGSCQRFHFAQGLLWIEFWPRETRGCQFFIFCLGLAQLDCLRSSIDFSSRHDCGPDFISSVASEGLIQPPPAFFFFRAEFFVPDLGLPGGISLRCYFGPTAGSFVAQLTFVLSSRTSFIFPSGFLLHASVS
jgi:hypothetical protein